MGLDDLMDCIEVLKERIQSHHAVLQENEARTRMALIDPLLRALGWDVSDPGVVIPEYRVGNRSADYALLQPDSHPAAIVEAKRLGETLAPHQMQVLNYANASDINYAGLTDGNHWELYSVFQQAPLGGGGRILDVSIAATPTHASALQLLLLWRPNLSSGEPIPANSPILAAQRSAPTLPDVEPALALRPVPPNWVALSDYAPPGKTPCPAVIRFRDGSERSLTRWYEILASVVERLCAERRLTVEDVPIGWGGQTYRVHTEPIHPTGKEFKSSRNIMGTSLFVNVHANAYQIRQDTKRLLRRYGLDPAEVFLQVAK